MRRIEGLDGVRGILAFLIVAVHAHMPGMEWQGPVDVFFVISGFLITGILVRELDATGSIDLARFWARRSRKLLPPLFLMLALMLAIGPQFAEQLWHAASMSSDYYIAFDPKPSPVLHTWSLSIEEHFYILWPLALLALRYVRRELWLPILLASFALSGLWLNLSYAAFGINPTYYRFDPRLSGLIAGAILSIAGHDRRWVTAVLVLCAFAAACALALGVPLSYGLGTPAATSLAMLVIAALQGNGIAALNGKALVWFGTQSYCVYLFHFPIVWWCNKHFNWQLAFAAGLLGALALAVLYNAVERRLAH